MTGAPDGYRPDPAAGNSTATGSDADPDGRFWRYIDAGEFRLPRCRRCRYWIAPPSFCCPDCLSRDLDWEELDGRGCIWSFTVYHHSFAAHLDAHLPYNVALIELSEGPMLLGNVEVDRSISQEEQLRVGLPVAMVVGRRDGQPLYWFMPVPAGPELLPPAAPRAPTPPSCNLSASTPRTPHPE